MDESTRRVLTGFKHADWQASFLTLVCGLGIFCAYVNSVHRRSWTRFFGFLWCNLLLRSNSIRVEELAVRSLHFDILIFLGPQKVCNRVYASCLSCRGVLNPCQSYTCVEVKPPPSQIAYHAITIIQGV